jgi:hypothetical protein
MKSTIAILFAAGSLCLAQQPQSSKSTAEAPKTPASGQAGTQTLTGVLMDATCDAIANRNVSEASKDVTNSVKTYTGASGSTGKVEHSATTSSTGSPGSTAATTGSVGAPNATGERSRTEDVAISTTVREKYGKCMVKADTNSFALYSDGRLILIEPASAITVRQQMSSEGFRGNMTDASGQPKWFTVTVTGKMKGDQLAVTSIRQ